MAGEGGGGEWVYPRLQTVEFNISTCTSANILRR